MNVIQPRPDAFPPTGHAVLNPVDLVAAEYLERLEAGWPLYRRYFVWKWHRSLRQKQAAWPRHYDLSEVRAMDNLTDMTEHLVRRYGGYPSLEDYLQGYAITGDALAAIRHPTRIITAADAIAVGMCGPPLRASGVYRDVRKDEPYAAYDEMEFDVPLGVRGVFFQPFQHSLLRRFEPHPPEQLHG